MSELAYDLCNLAPTESVDWPDGSGAAIYTANGATLIVAFDSDSNAIVAECLSATESVWADLIEQPAESWDLWDYVIHNEPDQEDLERSADEVRLMLGLPCSHGALDAARHPSALPLCKACGMAVLTCHDD